MTKEQMWKIINEEKQRVVENIANMESTQKNIDKAQEQLEDAFKKKDSAKAIELTEYINAQKKLLEIYRNIGVENEECSISHDEFMRCYSKDVVEPYSRRKAELREQLLAKREEYIQLMKDARKELIELSNNDREFWEINSKGNLDINLPNLKVDMRDFFINETRYFFED